MIDNSIGYDIKYSGKYLLDCITSNNCYSANFDNYFIKNCKK